MTIRLSISAEKAMLGLRLTLAVGRFSHLEQNKVSFASRRFMVYYTSTTRDL